MNYLVYLKQPHFLSLFCGLVSVILAFVESKYSKIKNDYKYYLKIFILVVINVYVVILLIKKGVVPLECSVLHKNVNMSGGGNGSNVDVSSINTSNYQTVDIGNPTF